MDARKPLTMVFINTKQECILTEDLFIFSLNFLSPMDWHVISGVSPQWYRATREEVLWNQYAESRAFPHAKPETKEEEKKPLETKVDSLWRSQCTADFLFNRAVNESRIDRKSYYFVQVLRYLHPHEKEAWANYYSGMIHYTFPEGDRGKGLSYLDSARASDYRATQVFARKLYGGNRQQKEECKKILKPEGVATILPTLTNAALNESIKGVVSLDIACLFLQEEKHHAARPWLESSIISQHDVKAAELLIKIDSPEIKEGTKEFITQFEKIYAKNSSRAIAYKIGTLYQNYFTEQKSVEDKEAEKKHSATAKMMNLARLLANKRAIKWFQIAVDGGEPLAAQKLAEFYLHGQRVKKDFQKAKEFYQLAFQLGATESLRLMANLILDNCLPGDELEAQHCLKKAFIAGDSESSKQLSRLFLEKKAWQKNPEQIWWLQVAAQCGCKKSLAALVTASKEDNAFAHCALAIVNSFTVSAPLRSTLFARAALKGFRTPPNLLEKIIKMDKKIIAIYREAGKNQGLLERHLQFLLDNWDKDLEEKNNVELKIG